MLAASHLQAWDSGDYTGYVRGVQPASFLRWITPCPLARSFQHPHPLALLFHIVLAIMQHSLLPVKLQSSGINTPVGCLNF